MSPTEMYQFSIQESAPIGTAVGRVKAEDSDVGENTDMTYHLREESGSGGDAFKVTTDSDTQEAIIVVQKVQLLGRVESGGGGSGPTLVVGGSHFPPLRGWEASMSLSLPSHGRQNEVERE